MHPIIGQPVPPYVQTICAVIQDFAGFTEPQPTAYAEGPFSIRLSIVPGMIAEVSSDGQHWHVQETTTDSSTGEPVPTQYDLGQFMPADRRYSPEEAAGCLVQFLITRLCTIVQNPGLPIGSRAYAARSLPLILNRMEGR